MINDNQPVSFDGFDTRIKKYSNGRIEYTKYSKPIFVKVDDWLKDVNTVKVKKPQSENGQIRDDSLNRTYGLLVDLAIENAHLFKSFVTLTFKDNITELDYANNKFRSFVVMVKRIYPDFKYLAVPEFQKRGAVHYHLMTNLSVHDKKVIQKQKGKKNMYDVKYWNHGFSSVFDLALTDDKFSVAAYMTKYFFKDIDNRLFGRNKILYSRSLKKPLIIRTNENSQENRNYQEYIDKYTKKIKEKSIFSDKEYAPSMSIYTFIPK